MKKELFDLAVKSIRKRRKSSILMFCILTLSLSFAVIALSVNESMNKSNEEYRYDTYGTWQAALLNGNKEDFEVFKKEKVIDDIGTAVCFGTIAEGVGYGTVENELKEMGRLGILEGKFPQKDDEIALEADVLSKLKYNYKIGQKVDLEISFPAVSYDGIETTVVVRREYKLCGVIKEYTDLWCVDNEILPGALVTDEEAFQIFQMAKTENTDVIVKEPKYHYFFKSDKDKAKVTEKVRQLLSSNAVAKEQEGKFMANAYAYQAEQEGFNSFYVVIIFLTTLLAVLCIYMVQMQKQIRQIALSRSIGITKRQLRLMLFFEILCLMLPAMLSGILVGSAGTWVAIKSLIKVITQKVYIAIPAAAIFLVFLLWVLGIFGIRTIILWIALRQPLTGKIKCSGKKILWYRKLKYLLCVIISVTACLVLFLGTLCSYELLKEKREIEKIPSYRFITMMPEEPKIEESTLQKMQQVPGITHITAWGLVYADMKFSYSGNCTLINDLKENHSMIRERSRENSDGLGVVLYGIREKNWEDYIDFEKLEIDKEKFRSGSEVIVLFPVNVYDEIVVEDRKYKDTGISKGEQITFDFYGKKADGKNEALVGREEKIGEYKTTAAVVKVKDNDEENSLQFMATIPYTVICSAEALESMLNQLPDDYVLSDYDTGKAFGYTQGEIFASSESGYFSTDYVIADLCSKYQISMDSYREENFSRIQGLVQNLIQLCVGSAAVFIIALLLSWNILSLAGEEEKNKIGILRAIGMSKKQQRRNIIRETIAVGVISITGGWIFFGLYLVFTAWRHQQEIWMNFQEKIGFLESLETRIESFLISGVHPGVIIAITIIGFGVVCAVYYGTKKKLLKEDILEFIREEE